jgi:hypothetical protein
MGWGRAWQVGQGRAWQEETVDDIIMHVEEMLCVVDSGVKGSSDVTTCSPLSESAGALEHSDGCPEGTCGVIQVCDWSLM